MAIPGTPAATILPSNVAVVQLDDGELVFDRTAVMHPPAVRFSTDISALFREWHQSTYLVVNGHGIPTVGKMFDVFNLRS